MQNSKDTSTGTTLGLIISAVALLMIGYHFFTVWFPIFNPILHQNIHLGFCFLLLFLAAMKKTPGGWTPYRIIMLLGMVIALGGVVFVHLNYERLAMWAGFPEPRDVAVGIVIVAAVIFLTWREWGFIFPTMVMIAIAYAFWGHDIPGPLTHPLLEPELILSNLAIGLEGAYGMMLGASANLIFLFIIFGSLFQVVGIDKFFIELGNYFGGHIRGGSAHTAIVSSGFVGMCTGSAPANVALTGSYSIPLMKETGFQPKHAAAIEAAASSGGQLTPPIMGVAVFIMAGFLGTDYGRLMLTAVVPAVFYYAIIAASVMVIASRDNVPKLKFKADKGMLWGNGPVFVLPMTVMTTLLILHYSPGYAALCSIIAMLVVAVLQRRTRPKLKPFLEGLTRGAVAGTSIGVACALIGMFMKMLTVTGAASKLATLSQTLAGGNLMVGLVYAMALSIILGCAMPIVVAYVVCAIVVAPVLVDMGLPQMTAHFFVFYFAVLSAVTPPVAAAAMVGSKIAESDYVKTSFEALKLSLPFFLVPYFLVANPDIMFPVKTFPGCLAPITVMALACGSLIVFVYGFFLTRITKLERIGYLAVAACATVFGLYGYLPGLVGALLLAIILVPFQIRRKIFGGSEMSGVERNSTQSA